MQLRRPAMQLLTPLLFLAAHASTAGAAGVRALQLGSASERLGEEEQKEQTISKVVKLLEQMMEDSKNEGEKERELFAKYKCYCDSTSKDKEQAIADAKEQIGTLGDKIEELRASNAALSTESAQLQADISANEEASKAAKKLRDAGEKFFKGAEADLTASMEQLQQAIDVLAAIGGKKPAASFLANHSTTSLSKLQADVQEAVSAASAFLKPGDRQKVASLMQTHFSGAADQAQSGGIIGILKSMKETFESNLKSAQGAEAAAVKAYKALSKTSAAEHKSMSDSLKDKKKEIGANDGDIADKKTSLETAEKQLADDQDFLAKLQKMCKTKTDEYEQRKEFRLNEQAAIAEAIAILDSDAAFETFGTVKATSEGATGFLLQTSASRHHLETEPRAALQRRQAVQLLQQAASSQHSQRLAALAALLSMGNPFAKVLEAIAQMKETIAAEAKADKEQKDWCKTETDENTKNLEAKKIQLKTLKTAIDKLTQSIDDPKTGFKVMIQEKEDMLVKNAESQEELTKTRKSENEAYEQSVANAQAAQALLKNAIKVLKKYYDALAKANSGAGTFLQEEPAPPDTWSGDYEGQKSKGANVLKMLTFVLTETKKEEDASHASEKALVKDFNKAMDDLKKEAKDGREALVKLRKSLADAEEDLSGKETEKVQVTREKTAAEKYLEDIKPGCDWIEKNFADREAHRSTEEKALDKATKLLKATPAYKAAEKDAAAAKK